jgi:uncharacterized protein (DUF58 family)
VVDARDALHLAEHRSPDVEREHDVLVRLRLELPDDEIVATRGRAGGRKLTRATYALEAGLAATDYRSAVVYLRSQVKARSLVILFTNVLDPRAADGLAKAVRGLLPLHLPLCVLMRDEAVEQLALAKPRSPANALVTAAAGQAVTWRRGLVRRLEDAGALVLDARPDDVTPELVKRYLEVKARRLL